MHAALQHNQGTMRPARAPLPWHASVHPMVGDRAAPMPTSLHQPQRFTIHGITSAGRTFRPSDWSERLAGAMSSFRPAAMGAGIGAHIGYSPYCVPQVVDGVKCVQVSEALKGVEPMAWDFVMNFARDNDLVVTPLGEPARPVKPR
jgi:hypothetical protein